MGNSIKILLKKSSERSLDLQKFFIISRKNFTVVGFNKLHIGAATFNFLIATNNYSQIKQFKFSQNFYLIFKIVPNR